MTEFECGCRIMVDVIHLNKSKYDKLYWGYILKTVVNVGGKCGNKQIKFQHMENKHIEMEKKRMKTFMYSRNEEEEKTHMMNNIKNSLER
jgi:hypothetical protein